MVKIPVEEHTLLTQCLPSDRLSFAEKVYTEYFPVIPFIYLSPSTSKKHVTTGKASNGIVWPNDLNR